jgi:hypothetical protein
VWWAWVKLAAFIVALACVSAAFSIDGLTAIFAAAFWPVITMGAALEAGKLVAAAWLTEHWNSAPPLLRLVLVAMIGVLMGLNAVGVFGFLTRAHLEHMMAVDLALADRTADIDARLAIQGQTVADLDRRIAQIDAAIEQSTRLGRPVGAMTIADQKRRDRADIVAERQHQAQALGSLNIEKAKIDAQRRRAEADVGQSRPVRRSDLYSYVSRIRKALLMIQVCISNGSRHHPGTELPPRPRGLVHRRAVTTHSPVAQVRLGILSSCSKALIWRAQRK